MFHVVFYIDTYSITIQIVEERCLPTAYWYDIYGGEEALIWLGRRIAKLKLFSWKVLHILRHILSKLLQWCVFYHVSTFVDGQAKYILILTGLVVSDVEGHFGNSGVAQDARRPDVQPYNDSGKQRKSVEDEKAPLGRSQVAIIALSKFDDSVDAPDLSAISLAPYISL